MDRAARHDCYCLSNKPNPMIDRGEQTVANLGVDARVVSRSWLRRPRFRLARARSNRRREGGYVRCRNAELVRTVNYRKMMVYGPEATLIVYFVDVSGPERPLQVELQKLDNPESGAEFLTAATIEGDDPLAGKFLLRGGCGRIPLPGEAEPEVQPRSAGHGVGQDPDASR